MDPYEWWLRCLSLTIVEIQDDSKDAFVEIQDDSKDAYELLSDRIGSLSEEDALILKTVIARTAIKAGPHVEGAMRELDEQMRAGFDQSLGDDPTLN